MENLFNHQLLWNFFSTLAHAYSTQQWDVDENALNRAETFVPSSLPVVYDFRKTAAACSQNIISARGRDMHDNNNWDILRCVTSSSSREKDKTRGKTRVACRSTMAIKNIIRTRTQLHTLLLFRCAEIDSITTNDSRRDWSGFSSVRKTHDLLAGDRRSRHTLMWFQ